MTLPSQPCDATDLAVEEAGGVCPFCNYPADKHRPERGADPDGGFDGPEGETRYAGDGKEAAGAR